MAVKEERETYNEFVDRQVRVAMAQIEAGVSMRDIVGGIVALAARRGYENARPNPRPCRRKA